MEVSTPDLELHLDLHHPDTAAAVLIVMCMRTEIMRMVMTITMQMRRVMMSWEICPLQCLLESTN